MCTLQETGHCPYGTDCFFAHAPEELQVKLPDDLLEQLGPQGATWQSKPNYGSDALFAGGQNPPAGIKIQSSR